MLFGSHQKFASSIATSIACGAAALMLLAAGAAALAGAANPSSGLPPGIPYASDADPVSFVAIVVERNLHRGEKVGVHVMTSSNAAAVTAQVGSIRMLLQKTGPGLFAGDARVPWWARSGGYFVTFSAIRTDGAFTHYIVPVRVR